MPHVLRDEQGRIVAILDRPSAGGSIELAADDHELTMFLHGASAKSGTARDLLLADLEFIRVIEDLIELLIQKGAVMLTDLPAASQAKLLKRGSLRRKLRDSTGLMDDDA
ncbi:MAG: hypothetical protein HY246_06875 [Proteobacteria bacterium]|nr:hypothetical protein [Pseudomonadota bacterium]